MLGVVWMVPADYADALAPTVVKNSLNSSAISFKSLENTGFEISLWGTQLLITFHIELFF